MYTTKMYIECECDHACACTFEHWSKGHMHHSLWHHVFLHPTTSPQPQWLHPTTPLPTSNLHHQQQPQLPMNHNNCLQKKHDNDTNTITTRPRHQCQQQHVHPPCRLHATSCNPHPHKPLWLPNTTTTAQHLNNHSQRGQRLANDSQRPTYDCPKISKTPKSPQRLWNDKQCPQMTTAPEPQTTQWASRTTWHRGCQLA